MHSTRSEYKVMMMTIMIGIIDDYTGINRPLHTIKTILNNTGNTSSRAALVTIISHGVYAHC